MTKAGARPRPSRPSSVPKISNSFLPSFLATVPYTISTTMESMNPMSKNFQGAPNGVQMQVRNRIMELMEGGCSPAEISKIIADESERKAIEESEAELLAEESEDEGEHFAAEIQIMAQALAWREACTDDLFEIYTLLDAAYSKMEIKDAKESFRKAPALEYDVFRDLFKDKSYKWLLCECPNGRNIEKDGVILGVSVFSTDGVSRRNGDVEGKLGSIRLFAILPRFRGVCIGLRMLQRTETMMKKDGCVRSLCCLASTRQRLHEWLQRRGYAHIGSSAYPLGAAQQTIDESKCRLDEEEEDSTTNKPLLKLNQYLKKLEEEDTASNKAGDKNKSDEEVASIITLNNGVEEEETEGGEKEKAIPAAIREKMAATISSELDAEVAEREYDPKEDPYYVEGKMHLPLIWRMQHLESLQASSQSQGKGSTGGEKEDIPID